MQNEVQVLLERPYVIALHVLQHTVHYVQIRYLGRRLGLASLHTHSFSHDTQ